MDSKQPAPSSSLVGLIVSQTQTWATTLLVLAALLLAGAAWFGYSARPDSASIAAEEARIKAEKLAKAEKPPDEFDLEGKEKPKDAEADRNRLPGMRAVPTGGMVWCLASALLLAIGGGLALSRSTVDRPTPTLARHWIVVFIGTFGLLTSVYGLFLMSQHLADILKAIDEKDVSKAGSLLQGLAVLFVGLVISFLSLQPAREDERNQASLRRLIHGYNSVLNGVLLLLILVGINIAAYMELPQKLDTTENSFYTLSEPSKKLLQSLTQPVRAYLLSASEGATGDESDLQTILGRCSDQSSQFRVKTYSAGVDLKAIAELLQRLKAEELVKNRVGILMTYGEDEKQVAFIPIGEIVERDPRTGRKTGFNGEARLMTELNFLANNDSKSPVIYFVQGHEELDMLAPGTPGAGTGKPGRTGEQIKAVLTESRYEVRTISFGPGAVPQSLDGADAVVVLAPQAPLSAAAISALDGYMFPAGTDKKPGRLLMFLPAWKELQGDAVGSTGTDALLARFGLKVNNTLLVQPGVPSFPDPRLIPLVHKLLAGDPLLPVFSNKLVIGYDSRVIAPINAPQGNMRARRLLATPNGLDVWQESNYGTNPEATFEQFPRDPKLVASKKPQYQALVGVLVSESTAPPGPPGSPPPPPAPGDIPRMVLMGTGDCFSDGFLSDPKKRLVPSDYTELFKGLVDWVRNKPEAIGVKAKEYKVFALNQNASESRVIWIPLALICLSSIVMGIGVWVLRRK